MTRVIRALVLGALMTGGILVSAQAPSAAKAAFQQVDRMPRRAMSDGEWREARKDAAFKALATLSGAAAGEDLFFVGMLESVGERWKPAADHLGRYLTLAPGSDHDATMNRITAQTTLRDVFIKGGLAAEAEAYYASDPIGLAIYFSTRGDHARALATYEQYLASGPPPDRARTTKSLIVIQLGSMRRPDEMARRLEAYMGDLTPNAIVNDYSTLSRLYTEAGDDTKAARYLKLLFDYGLQSQDDKVNKAIDGPVNAHINWLIKRLEAANDPSALNNFLHRVRTEFAGKPSILSNLESRDVYRAVLNQPAKELKMTYVVNGPRTDLKSLRGRVVLLDFFAHWCGPCIADFPIVRDLQKRFEPQGLTVLGLTGLYGYYQGQRPLAPEAEVRRMEEHFAKEYQVTWPMIFEPSRTNDKNYGVSYIPHLVLIDRTGVVRFAKVGTSDERELEQQIVTLLGERAPAPQTFRASSDLVVLQVGVYDRNSDAVVNLTRDQFRVYEDDVLQDVRFFVSEERPVAVGLVVDNSISMIDKRQQIIAAAEAFARSSHRDDALFTVNFNERVWFGLPVGMEFTSDRAVLHEALARMQARGTTALYDATSRALDHIAKSPLEGRILIVVSDGDDNSSHMTLDAVLSKAAERSAVIYTVGLFDEFSSRSDRQTLERLADATGGLALFPAKVRDVTQLLERIARDIRHRYTLGYESTNPRRDGRFRKIRVVAVDADRKMLRVRARAGYVAPAGQTDR